MRRAPGPRSTTSKPSIIAATTSAHRPASSPPSGSATITNRSMATPSSTAARTPNVGRPATAIHAPSPTGPAAIASASDTAAAPEQPMVLPRCTTPPGTSPAKASTSGRVRLRAAVTSLPAVVTPAGSGTLGAVATRAL